MNEQKIKQKRIDFKELLEQVTEELNQAKEDPTKFTFDINSTGEVSETLAHSIFTKLAVELRTDDLASLYICAAILIQKGATAPSMPLDTKVSWKDVTLTHGAIKRACRAEKVTVRQLARGMKSAIPKIMKDLGDLAPEGNLAKQMRMELSNVTREEAIWASDFQTYNEECPERVRKWLVSDYKNKFRKERK